MATIKEIIERVDDTKPNAFTQKVKMAWIAELDGRIAADVMLMSIDEIREREFQYPDDLASEPLVSYPHQDIYVYWLEAMIDYANGEYSKYQNSMEMYNQHYGNFLRWFASTYEPIRGYPQKEWPADWDGPPYYITAYGLAVKQGYQGTLDEWIASLKGEKGDQGDRVELRYEEDMVQWRWIPAQGLENTDEESQWRDLISMAEIRGNIIEATLEEAQNAADTATEMAQAARNAEKTAQAANASSWAASKSAQTNAATAQQAAEESVKAAADAEASAENAKQYADTIDTEQINANIASKADDLYFDTETSLLYLVSNGQLIGTGVQVATTGGGGGGTLSYTIAMKNLLDSRVITVSEGTDVVLRFSYTSVDEEGVDDGPGIGKIIVNNATRQTFTAEQGDNTVDVTQYLAVGSNTVKVQIENSEGAKKTLSYTVTVAAAILTSAFDASAPFTGDIPFTYVPTGIAEKTVHFELDGAEIGTAIVTASGRQQSYTIPAQTHGAHTLRAWFECEIEETVVTSNVISFAIICIEEGNTTPIIAINSALIASVEQYANIVKKYRVYDPTSLTAAITLEANGETVGSLTVDRTEQTWTYRPTEVGELVQTIRCGDEYASWVQTVTESTIKVEAETEALALHLSSYGRSNNEENPGVWESGNVACEFRNFNFVSDGWKQDEEDNTVLRVIGDARLNIPYKMFAYDFRTTGKTIEFELATREVLDYDAEVINCFSGGRGFSITAQQLILASEQSKLGTRYKEEEHIRVTFVAEKKSENRLLLCYINGIMSGSAQYPENDDFSQTDPVGITIGSNDCTTDLYNIRVYDNDLTRFQVLDNWIADTQNGDERIKRYLRNNIYDAYGRVVISQLPNDLCYLVLQCSELPQFKGDKKTCSGYFVDLVHPERSFTFENAEIDVQGTSSQYYWRKNYKIKFKGGFILFDGTTATVYAMNEDTVPVSVYTMKADVASSEGYYNTVTAKLFNRFHPFTMPAQEADPRSRYSIDGFPIVIFWDNGATTQFLGKYNFNHDKGTPEPFGLSEGDERWEVLQNGTARVGFHSADFSGNNWQEDFEGNYPDGSTDLTNLEPMCAWVTSTDTDQATGATIDTVTYDGVEYTTDTAEYRQAKFNAELAQHFVESAVIYYYVFTEAFLCMDQREKNVLWRYIGSLLLWLADYYDADSIIGFNNQAQPVFDYWMEDIDYTASGDPVYNGQNSTFWKNLRETRQEKIQAEWHRLRDAGFSYETAIAAFAEHKEKWPEAIYNEDMQVKCLDALEQEGDGTYLPFLRGDKWAWTQQWLYKRFRYLDSKYEYGSSLENRATIRTNVMENITATYFMKMYGHVYYNAEHVAQRVEKDTPMEFVSHATGAEDRVIGLNDADQITDLGDLSRHQVELIDLSKMIRLKSLKLGDASGDYVNNALNSVTFGNNTLLRTVDMRNCASFAESPDLSGCTNIEEAYFDGTSITGLALPNGGNVKILHLPETVTSLTLRNQTKLTDFSIPSYSNISTLWLEGNSDAIDPLAILNEIPENSRVRVLGINLEAESSDDVAALLAKLDSMRGLDESGNNTDYAQVSGTVHVPELSRSVLSKVEAAKEKYPSLTVTYDALGAYLTTQLVERTLSGEYTNDRVTTVGRYAFAHCTELTKVVLPSATHIGSEATPWTSHCGFTGATKLVILDLPVCVYVQHHACTLPMYSIRAIILRNTKQTCAISHTQAFSGVGNDTYFYVPKAMDDGTDGITAYEAASNWSAYAGKFRYIEDFTIDGTLTGELDESKI